VRPTISLAVCAVLVSATLSALSAPPENTLPTYDVEIRIKNLATKKEAYVLKARVWQGHSTKLTSEISHRPFVTGLTESNPKKAIIQIIEFGAAAEVKISENDSGALAVDASIEVTDVTDVKAKQYPGTEENVQTVRVGTSKSRLLETMASGEKLNSTLSLGGITYDATVSVVRN
jgi:hypothetical protein